MQVVVTFFFTQVRQYMCTYLGNSTSKPLGIPDKVQNNKSNIFMEGRLSWIQRPQVCIVTAAEMNFSIHLLHLSFHDGMDENYQTGRVWPTPNLKNKVLLSSFRVFFPVVCICCCSVKCDQWIIPFFTSILTFQFDPHCSDAVTELA